MGYRLLGSRLLGSRLYKHSHAKRHSNPAPRLGPNPRLIPVLNLTLTLALTLTLTPDPGPWTLTPTLPSPRRVKGQFEERNPYCDACGKQSAGYAIISGEWMG